MYHDKQNSLYLCESFINWINMIFKHDVFISYKSCDQKFAVKLKNNLIERDIKVWMDNDEIRPGDLFVDTIEKGIETSKTIVFVISTEAMESGWVKEEYAQAVSIEIEGSQQRRIIPLILRDAKLPMCLKNRQWVDFRDEKKFESSLQKLVWGIIGEMDRNVLLPEGELPLHETMLKAENSLIISGHTLDKFSQDIKVKNALGTLFERGVHVTLIMLNPYSSYSKAHEPFHILQSRTLAHDQIMNTINVFYKIFILYHKPLEFEVLLTNYMPRFRTILIDDELCYVNLYMYSKDVGVTPKFELSRTSDGIGSSWFQIISDSIFQMIQSKDIIPFIKNGRFNENWENSRVHDPLIHCLETSCCRNRSNCLDMIHHTILGYQNKDPTMVYRFEICNKDYKPGTFTLDSITPDADFLESPMTFDEWIENTLEDDLEIIEKAYPTLFQHESKHNITQKVKKALNIRPIGEDISLKHKIWYQENSDIIRRLIMTILASSPDFSLDIYPNLTNNRQAFIFKVVNWLKKFKNPGLKDWLHLSVAAGLLGIDEKPFHAATSSINPVKSIILNRPKEDEEIEIQRVGNEIWKAAKSPCRIDATNIFFHTLEMSSHCGFRIVSFPDDYLETIILLKFYEELLKHFHNIEIDCIPRSTRCSNDATYDDIQEFLEKFPYLKNDTRFCLIENGPKVGGINLLKLHPNVIKLIEKASLLDIRGARSYEMMQGVNKEAYFGFMVCREFSESVIGLPAEDRPFVYLRQSPQEHSFKGFTLRHDRQQNGKMFAKVTAMDQKKKWEGGHLAEFDSWSNNRKTRYKIPRDFYSSNAPEFHWKYGNNLEIEVKKCLNAFSGRVLVIGCGSGKEVQYLSERDCDAFGIDFSSEAILLAQKEHPSLKNHFFIEDMYNLNRIMSGEFDGIIANAVLVHLLDRNDMFSILKMIWKRLKNNGLCFIRVIEKKNVKEELDNHLFGGLRWFVYYSEEELKRLTEEIGFIVEKIDTRPHTQYPGINWISIILRKNSSYPPQRQKESVATRKESDRD